MSLIRLLTTTRSLSDVKNEPSPYRMTEQGLLPKFGPKKARGAESLPPHVGGYKSSPDVGAYKEEEKNLGEGNGDRMDAGCSLKSESSRKPRWLAGWWQKLFRRRPRRERREPVQAEFALDLVKVVRNDLSDEEMREAKCVTRDKAECVMRNKKEHQPEVESVFGASRG